MKHQVKFLLMGFVLATSFAGNTAKPNQSAALNVPSQQELKQMCKRTLLSWNHAVQTKDFTPIYNSAATAWKKKTSPEKIRQSFRGFIDKSINIKAIQSLEPVFSPRPFIGQVAGVKGVLQVSGHYKTKPERTEFDLMYIKEKATWRIALIHVYVGSYVFIGSDGEMG